MAGLITVAVIVGAWLGRRAILRALRRSTRSGPTVRYPRRLGPRQSLRSHQEWSDAIDRGEAPWADPWPGGSGGRR